MTRIAALLLVLASPVIAGETVFHDLRDRRPVPLAELVDELASRDVVFLGEEHDSDAGHAAQAAIVAALLERRPDAILSLEVFERDVQAVLDDFLAGRIDEAAFLKHARPWPNHAEHYRPLLELARERNLPVIAANVPRRAASAVSKGETPDRADAAFLPRQTTAPADAYRDRFAEAMSGHGGHAPDAKTVDRYYAAQCLKDDAMAEAIADALAARSHRRPLVIHVCGRFHSDHGLGTAARLLARRPLASIGVVTTEVTFDPARPDWTELADRGHYAIAVARPPVEAPRPE